MKYYSEKLKQFFDTEDACLVAEKEAEAKKSAEKVRLEKVQKLEKEYLDALADFVEKYGYYKSDIVKYESGKTARFPFQNLYNLFLA